MRMYDVIMNKRETADLTIIIVKSGDEIDLSKIKVYKYSTRGGEIKPLYN